ncbi:hypothetical protein FHS70_000859 [Flammeovirga yaeyamensis]|nr:hypothetical protein [Flammeovirga yaeyamensis]
MKCILYSLLRLVYATLFMVIILYFNNKYRSNDNTNKDTSEKYYQSYKGFVYQEKN